MVLDEFPEWLERCISRIKDTNDKLKRISNEKKENRLSTFQGCHKKGKKNNHIEDDVTFGPRDCDIGINPYLEIKKKESKLTFKSLQL